MVRTLLALLRPTRTYTLSTAGFDMRTGEAYTIHRQVVVRCAKGRVRTSHKLPTITVEV